jgi:hypothetical protein
LILFAALSVAAAIVMMQPLVRPLSPWSWSPVSQTELIGADVNADVQSIGPDGLVLAMQGQRPISLILPPQPWTAATPPDLRVTWSAEQGVSQDGTSRVTRTETSQSRSEPAAPGQRVIVRLLWQEAPTAAYRFTEHETLTPASAESLDLPLPISPSRLFRVGIQFVGTDSPLLAVRLHRIDLPAMPASSRLALAWRSLATPEPLANHSLNFLRGPAPLARPLNAYLLLAACVGVGCAGAVAAARGRRLPRFAVAAPLVVAWLVVDGWATWNLTRQARAERAAFADHSPAEQDALAWGPDIAWAAAAIQRHALPGDTYAVISDDPFAPAHRIDYLLAPLIRRIDDAAQADYVVVLPATRARIDESSGALVIQTGDAAPLTISGDARPWSRVDHVEPNVAALYARSRP